MFHVKQRELFKANQKKLKKVPFLDVLIHERRLSCILKNRMTCNQLQVIRFFNLRHILPRSFMILSCSFALHDSAKIETLVDLPKCVKKQSFLCRFLLLTLKWTSFFPWWHRLKTWQRMVVTAFSDIFRLRRRWADVWSSNLQRIFPCREPESIYETSHCLRLRIALPPL